MAETPPKTTEQKEEKKKHWRRRTIRVNDGPDRMDLAASLMEGTELRRLSFPFGFTAALPGNHGRNRGMVAVNSIARVNGNGKFLLIRGVIHLADGDDAELLLTYNYREKSGKGYITRIDTKK
jgi:hypothetical protein